MKITREKVNELNILVAEERLKGELASELLRTAQDRYGEEKVSRTRDGETEEVRQKYLWEEVFLQAKDGTAVDVLKALHPQVFEAYEAQNKAGDALHKFVHTELGFDYRQMRISSYIELCEAIFDMKMAERDAA